MVIPVYNGAGTISRAVRSVLDQTAGELELIIVNDGSSDDLDGQLVRFEDSRIRLIRTPQRRGVANARNKGIAEATGEFIAFLDSDDEWMPNKLEVQLASMRAEPEHVLASCTGYLMRRSPNDFGISWRPSRQSYRYGDMVSGCFLSPGSTMMVRRSHFEKAGMFNETLARLEDWDWLLRSAKIAQIHALPQALACIHRSTRPSSVAISGAVKKMREIHEADARQEGGMVGTRFRAALQLELSAAAFNQGNFFSSGFHLARSLFFHPFRPPSFYASLIRTIIHR